MEKYINDFIDEFRRISRKGWIKSVNSNQGGIGLTFERELNKDPDDSFLPDYNGIEIKCTSRFSLYPLYLFTTAFDGPKENEVERIAKKYGNRDKDFIFKKVIFARINTFSRTKINRKYYLKLNNDKKEEKIFLEVYDRKYNLIEKRAYITYRTLYNHICVKLNTLALIHASKKKVENIDFFRYYQLEIFKLKGFDTFLYLLDQNIIRIELISRIYKSGPRKGKYQTKNIVVSMEKEHTEKLFNKIYELNYDKNVNNYQNTFNFYENNNNKEEI